MINTKLTELISKHNIDSLHNKKTKWLDNLKKYYPIKTRKTDVKNLGINAVINQKDLIKFLYFNNLPFINFVVNMEKILTNEVKENYFKSLNGSPLKIPKFNYKSAKNDTRK